MVILYNPPSSANRKPVLPMSLLALHPNVRFSFYRHGIGTCEAEMH